jgi:hypothetical protein
MQAGIMGKSVNTGDDKHYKQIAKSNFSNRRLQRQQGMNRAKTITA